ncbi:MAG: serine kinase [Rhodobacteraceae bacterium]|nr:MAG: serine kinase [Paracoccaceae bacterium]
MSHAPDAELVHGSAVAFDTGEDWVGVLILGPSGSGKSELALELIALGARLVADDQTEIYTHRAGLRLRAPARLRGLIELRGLGLLRAAPITDVDLVLVVDLAEQETERLPYRHQAQFLGVLITKLRRSPSRIFALGLRHYVMGRNWMQDEMHGGN